MLTDSFHKKADVLAIEKIQELTKEEKETLQLFYLRRIKEDVEQTNKNVQFFFWVTAISIFIVLAIVFFNANTR